MDYDDTPCSILQVASQELTVDLLALGTPAPSTDGGCSCCVDLEFTLPNGLIRFYVSGRHRSMLSEGWEAQADIEHATGDISDLHTAAVTSTTDMAAFYASAALDLLRVLKALDAADATHCMVEQRLHARAATAKELPCSGA